MNLGMHRLSSRNRVSILSLRHIFLLIFVILQLAVVYLIFYRKRPENNHAQPETLGSERERLIDAIEQWNKRATSAGVSDLIALKSSDSIGTATNILQKLVTVEKAHQDVVSSAVSSMHEILPKGMKTKEQMAIDEPELLATVQKYAIDNEIMLGLADAVMICKNTTSCWWNGGNILGSFIEIIKRNNITNHLIGVLDEEAGAYCKEHGVNYFFPKVVIPKAQTGTRSANRVSTIKYTLVQQLIQLGIHTLVVDMDLVFLDNPFKHLHRDADLEAQTDGFDDMAYGAMDSIQDPTMGWGGGGLYMKTFTVNVGCAYMRATPRMWLLVKRVADRLAVETGWDQQVFNKELLTMSHGDYNSTYASLRVMDYMKFSNSKIFFRSRRHLFIPGKTAQGPAPVMVHMNYHPDKHARMLCIMARYFKGELDACDAFPGGSEKGT